MTSENSPTKAWPRAPLTRPVLGYSVVFVFGLASSRFIRDIPFFRVDPNIDLAELGTLGASVFVSIVLYRYFAKVQHSDQLRKAALMERLSRCLANVDKVDSFCEADAPDYTEVANACKRCRGEFEAYATFAGSLGMPIVSAKLQEFQLICSDLRNLMTNTEPKGTPNPQLTVADGKLSIDRNRLVEIEEKVTQARQYLYGIQKEIITDIS